MHCACDNIGLPPRLQGVQCASRVQRGDHASDDANSNNKGNTSARAHNDADVAAERSASSVVVVAATAQRRRTLGAVRGLDAVGGGSVTTTSANATPTSSTMLHSLSLLQPQPALASAPAPRARASASLSLQPQQQQHDEGKGVCSSSGGGHGGVDSAAVAAVTRATATSLASRRRASVAEDVVRQEQPRQHNVTPAQEAVATPMLRAIPHASMRRAVSATAAAAHDDANNRSADADVRAQLRLRELHAAVRARVHDVLAAQQRHRHDAGVLQRVQQQQCEHNSDRGAAATAAAARRALRASRRAVHVQQQCLAEAATAFVHACNIAALQLLNARRYSFALQWLLRAERMVRPRAGRVCTCLRDGATTATLANDSDNNDDDDDDDSSSTNSSSSSSTGSNSSNSDDDGSDDAFVRRVRVCYFAPALLTCRDARARAAAVTANNIGLYHMSIGEYDLACARLADAVQHECALRIATVGVTLFNLAQAQRALYTNNNSNSNNNGSSSADNDTREQRRLAPLHTMRRAEEALEARVHALRGELAMQRAAAAASTTATTAAAAQTTASPQHAQQQEHVAADAQHDSIAALPSSPWLATWLRWRDEVALLARVHAQHATWLCEDGDYSAASEHVTTALRWLTSLPRPTHAEQQQREQLQGQLRRCRDVVRVQQRHAAVARRQQRSRARLIAAAAASPSTSAAAPALSRAVPSTTFCQSAQTAAAAAAPSPSVQHATTRATTSLSHDMRPPRQHSNVSASTSTTTTTRTTTTSSSRIVTTMLPQHVEVVDVATMSTGAAAHGRCAEHTEMDNKGSDEDVMLSQRAATLLQQLRRRRRDVVAAAAAAATRSHPHNNNNSSSNNIVHGCLPRTPSASSSLPPHRARPLSAATTAAATAAQHRRCAPSLPSSSSLPLTSTAVYRDNLALVYGTPTTATKTATKTATAAEANAHVRRHTRPPSALRPATTTTIALSQSQQRRHHRHEGDGNGEAEVHVTHHASSSSPRPLPLLSSSSLLLLTGLSSSASSLSSATTPNIHCLTAHDEAPRGNGSDMVGTHANYNDADATTAAAATHGYTTQQQQQRSLSRSHSHESIVHDDSNDDSSTTAISSEGALSPMHAAPPPLLQSTALPRRDIRLLSVQGGDSNDTDVADEDSDVYE